MQESLRRHVPTRVCRPRRTPDALSVLDDHSVSVHGAKAGYFDDALQGVKACLVLEPGDHGWSGPNYLDFARRHYSDADVVICRHLDQHARLDGFRDYLYYVRLDQRPVRKLEDASITTRRAKPPGTRPS